AAGAGAAARVRGRRRADDSRADDREAGGRPAHGRSLAARRRAPVEFFDYEAHLRKLQALYGERCAAMLASLERSFPRGTQWTRPDGGLFVWARLPFGIDAQELLSDAMREKVAFVPGAPFYPHEPQRNTLRLNFSNRPPELI